LILLRRSSSLRRSSIVSGVLAVLLISCRAKEAAGDRSSASAPTRPGDSLATSGEGVEIWFTLSREGRRPDGTRCVERALEIRRAGTRIPVPLLYTGATPTLLDSSTMRAELWNHCQSVDTYLVDLQSGRPVRQGARSR
jgi:hypothetical protein